MKYKALMLDVDGTTVPYDYDAVPSDVVTNAIRKAQEVVTVCFVTGRSYSFLQKVLDKLQMTSGFAVVNNGGHIINIATKEILHQQLILTKDALEIASILKKEGISFSVKGDPFVLEYVDTPDQIVPDDIEPSMFFALEDYSSEQIDTVIKKLSHISTIAVHKTHHKHPHKFGVLISHANATKLNGIYELAKYISIEPAQMIGVGDSYNDFPLLMACGFKVAMGNAVAELKAIADYVAPTVQEDGVADVINKFILIPTPSSRVA